MCFRHQVIEANMFDRLGRVAKSYANAIISNAEVILSPVILCRISTTAGKP